MRSRRRSPKARSRRSSMTGRSSGCSGRMRSTGAISRAGCGRATVRERTRGSDGTVSAASSSNWKGSSQPRSHHGAAIGGGPLPVNCPPLLASSPTSPSLRTDLPSRPRPRGKTCRGGGDVEGSLRKGGGVSGGAASITERDRRGGPILLSSSAGSRSQARSRGAPGGVRHRRTARFRYGSGAWR